jgi:prepilin-type N-terminal cleavage/methylation domain-containing protein
MTDTHQRERTDARPRGGSLTINPKYGGTRGYTLVEMIVVLVVVGVLTSFGIPQFTRALEQSRADVAGANLRAIWTAERIYWLDNRNYTDSLPVLVNLNLLDPSITSSTSNTFYTYNVTTPDTATFTATAQRAGNGSWSGSLTITQDGTLSGTLTCPGQASIVVDF